MNTEIDKLREFRSELAEPGEQRLAHIRQRIEGTNVPAPVAARRWSKRTVAVPAVAAASVLAVAVGAAAIGLTRPDQGAGNPLAAQSTREPRPVPGTPTAVPGEKTASAPDMPAPAEHKAAVDLLERFAANAGSWPAPLTVPAGQLLYVRGAGASSAAPVGGTGPAATGTQSYLHELWLDVNGCIAVMIRRTDGGQVTVVAPDPTSPKDNHEQQVAEQRARLAAEGPSHTLPTPAFLAALPTDPEAMLATLHEWAAGGGAWSPDHAILDNLRNLLYNAEPLLTPQVRASLYRALAKLGSIRSTGQPFELDGRQVYAIAQSERGLRQELLLDADTGRVVGSRTDATDSVTHSPVTLAPAAPEFYDLWTYAVVAQPGQTPG